MSLRHAACLALALGAAQAPAAEPLGISFIHKDWALVCDNTRTCRAEGYQSEEGGSEPVSLQITRAAGPGAPVSMALAYSTEARAAEPFQFNVGKARVGGLSGEPLQVPAAAAAGLLPELLRNETARLASARDQVTWTLSLAGLKAVLLKMDEAQGRLDTPGALVRRGARPESSVPAPPPAPVVRRVVPVATRPSDAALGPRILASIKRQDIEDQCNASSASAGGPNVVRLTANRVALTLPCSQGAYNFTFLLFSASDKKPYGARLLQANGEFDEKTGVVQSSMKGRGLGDCWSSDTWVFDGQDFVLAESAGSAMCRGFPGGAWSSPTYVTRVEPPLP